MQGMPLTVLELFQGQGSVSERLATLHARVLQTMAAVDRIAFASGFCRRDIGWREVAREAAGKE